MVNLLPNLAQGETISTVMPLPEEDEASKDDDRRVRDRARAMYGATRSTISSNVHANGKIAMKFEGEDADDRLIAAAICTVRDDILLAMRNGKVIRFPTEDVRVFSSRSSVGVRGVKLAKDDEVFSMSILRHEDVESGLRAAYVKEANRRRRGEEEDEEADDEESRR